MRVRILLALAGSLLGAAQAHAGNTINPNVPAQNSTLSSAVVRGNFAAAYNDVTNILGGYAGTTAPGSPVVFQDWLDTSATPAVWKKRYNSGWGTIGTFNLSTGVFIPGVLSVAQTANTVFAGPTSGAAAAPAFRALVGADLPLPAVSTLGGVFSKAAVTSNWLRSLGTDGAFTASQPACSDLSDDGAFCSSTDAANLSGTVASGRISGAYGGITGVGTLASGAVPTTLLTGALQAAQFPALTGDVTTVAGALATTLVTAQSGAHTWAAIQTFTQAPVFTDASGTRTALGLGALATVTPGTGVATALAVNVGSAGAFVTFNGALGTPSSGTATNLTGTASGLTAGNVTGTGVASATSLALGGCTISTHALCATGTASISGATTIAGALTYGGVTLSNAVTGTGNMVLSAGPSFSGTLGGTFTVGAGATWNGATIAGSFVATPADASGAPSTTFGVVKCDGTTITCASGVITAVGGVATSVQVGVTTVTSGTTTRILYNLAGVLAEYAISGTGSVCMTTSCSMTTPALGVATATSINGLAITTSAGTLTVANNASAALITAGNFGLTLTASATTNATFPAGTQTLAALTLASQVVSGGATVTAASISTGSFTADCGLRPLQYVINNGAYTITAPAADGACYFFVRNGASAGATTFTGFTVGSSTGAALTTTNGNRFTISVWRVTDGTGSTSGYNIFAHQ